MARECTICSRREKEMEVTVNAAEITALVLERDALEQERDQLIRERDELAGRLRMPTGSD